MKTKYKLLIFVICCSLSFNGNAQRLFNSTKKISSAKGTFWAAWGYHRSFYTDSDLHIKDSKSDFTLRNAQASDDPGNKFSDYFDFSKSFKPQFNLRAGYYYMDRYAFSLGYDHMKYILDDGNQVLLDGYVDSTLNNAIWSGNYKNKAVVTNRTDFHYQNNGLDYIRLELNRTDKLYQSHSKYFAISSHFGLGFGVLISKNTYIFPAQNENATTSISGYALTANAGLRFEFFRHIFILPQLSGGSMNQRAVRTDAANDRAIASQKYWYGQRSISIGFFHYFKPSNTCSDCPVW